MFWNSILSLSPSLSSGIPDKYTRIFTDPTISDLSTLPFADTSKLTDSITSKNTWLKYKYNKNIILEVLFFCFIYSITSKNTLEIYLLMCESWASRVKCYVITPCNFNEVNSLLVYKSTWVLSWKTQISFLNVFF